MAKRLIHTTTSTTRQAKVYKDLDWDEYRVKFFKLENNLWVHQVEADYHTPDKVDAIDTANSFTA